MFKKLYDAINNLDNLKTLNPASEADVTNAEKILGLKFADDYCAYTTKCGALSGRRIELTGVVPSKRLNVVDATVRERKRHKNLPSDVYVIEDLGIMDLVTVQRSDGKIFFITFSGTLSYICDSLQEYIEQAQDD